MYKISRNNNNNFGPELEQAYLTDSGQGKPDA